MKLSLTAAILFLLSISTITHASKPPKQLLSDAQSDPNTLQLMVGFPPPIDKRVTLPDSNFFSFPKLRWSVCHMRELLPTASIARNLYAFTPLKYALLPGIDELTFNPSNSNKRMTWQQSLAANYTDGMLILHKGKVVYERYRGCLDEHTNHAAMSMTKSLTGLVAEILIAQGKLNDKTLVKKIIPELTNSAFGDATVRQVMDMTTALKYSEHYADPNADIWQYSYAANPLPKPKEYTGSVSYFEYLKTVQRQGQHGAAFGYKTVNSDVLGWIVSKVTNKKFDELASKLVWSKIGSEHNADITVDGLGTPFAGGGLSATLRDLARLGLAVTNQGAIDGVQVIPAKAIASIQTGGDKNAFSKAGFSSMPNGSYRSMWWHFHNENGAFAARGVHGQTIYIDPAAEMVIVRLASHPVAANGVIDPTSLPAYQAVADFLMKQSK
ncbi:serine hydrolase domain-containing protein [Pseudoalteromonas phenolica]|nr:serine hydrolase [Pseudoalteromonas phenolica]